MAKEIVESTSIEDIERLEAAAADASQAIQSYNLGYMTVIFRELKKLGSTYVPQGTLAKAAARKAGYVPAEKGKGQGVAAGHSTGQPTQGVSRKRGRPRGSKAKTSAAASAPAKEPTVDVANTGEAVQEGRDSD